MTNVATRSPSAGTRIARRTAILCIAGALLSWQSLAHAVTVSDGTFADGDWTITSFSSGSGGNSTAEQIASGGNPGSYRLVTDGLTGGGVVSVVAGVSIYGPFTYTPSVSGTIGSIDYSEDAACTSGCFGQGQSTGPALLQNGNFYTLCSLVVITGPGTTFVNHTLNGLTAADFGIVSLTSTNTCDPSVHPDFSSAAPPIKVGFFRANGTGPGGGGYTLAAGIDNWQITLNAAGVNPLGLPPIIPVPTLGVAGMLLLALAIGLLGFAYLRRAR
jgi:IPTL-CTERM motif